LPVIREIVNRPGQPGQQPALADELDPVRAGRLDELLATLS
jgi:hypothetical protein